MLIDTHCHLVDERFEDAISVIERAKEAGVGIMVMPTGNLGDAVKAIDLAKRTNQFAMVGIHPEDIDSVYGGGVRSFDSAQDDKLEKVMEEMKNIIRSSNRVVGIGEIGLDFYFDKEKKTKEQQVELFGKQLDLAVELNLPVVIHMREAEEEMIEELEKYGDGFRVKPGTTDPVSGLPRPASVGLAMTDGEKFNLRGQFHCFAGSETFLKYILSRGFYVSFAGNITFKSAGNLRELIKKVPEDRLLLETDSPYLSPEPLRGRLNEPANVKIIAEFIARELNIEPEILAENTTKNAKCLYSLDI